MQSAWPSRGQVPLKPISAETPSSLSTGSTSGAYRQTARPPPKCNAALLKSAQIAVLAHNARLTDPRVIAWRAYPGWQSEAFVEGRLGHNPSSFTNNDPQSHQIACRFAAHSRSGPQRARRFSKSPQGQESFHPSVNRIFLPSATVRG